MRAIGMDIHRAFAAVVARRPAWRSGPAAPDLWTACTGCARPR
jgi:predicted nucleic acid-binding protein